MICVAIVLAEIELGIIMVDDQLLRSIDGAVSKNSLHVASVKLA